MPYLFDNSDTWALLSLNTWVCDTVILHQHGSLYFHYQLYNLNFFCWCKWCVVATYLDCKLMLYTCTFQVTSWLYILTDAFFLLFSCFSVFISVFPFISFILAINGIIYIKAFIKAICMFIHSFLKQDVVSSLKKVAGNC